MIYITRHCRIEDYKLTDNGTIRYEARTGALDSFLDGAWKALGAAYPKFYKMDRLSKLGIIAAEMLLKDTEVVRRSRPEQIAIVLSNAHASLDTDKRYFESTRTIASPALFVYTLTNIAIGEMCIRHGLKGENAFFVLPEFDAGIIAGYVSIIMANAGITACIAGWLDVIDDRHDVFLYLAERSTDTQVALEHTPEQLLKLYHSEYGTVDGRS